MENRGERGTLLSHYVVKQQYGRELCALLQYGHVRWFMKGLCNFVCSRRDIKKRRCLLTAGHNEIHVLLKLKKKNRGGCKKDMKNKFLCIHEKIAEMKSVVLPTLHKCKI
jgi:hypothetical protein